MLNFNTEMQHFLVLVVLIVPNSTKFFSELI